MMSGQSLPGQNKEGQLGHCVAPGWVESVPTTTIDVKRR